MTEHGVLVIVVEKEVPNILCFVAAIGAVLVGVLVRNRNKQIVRPILEDEEEGRRKQQDRLADQTRIERATAGEDSIPARHRSGAGRRKN